MICKYCSEGSIKLAEAERPGNEPGVDERLADPTGDVRQRYRTR